MVVLAASICTRGGKAVLSRQFREVSRSRIEGLLASFPKLADSGTQHTTVEQDNVRYVYQPLDELYMVLITNRQSNILQDIDSLHLFAQVVSSICKSLDEREILRNAYELLSAFDELVALGYRENLSLAQIKTFLEMESHEERIQEIISRNKELEATEDRKRKAKHIELQRKEMARSGRGAVPRTPSYPTYTPSSRTSVVDSYDTYEAEKNRSLKTSASKGKGMQLGKKSKTTDMFEKVRGDLRTTAEDSTPLVPNTQPAAPVDKAPSARMSTSLDQESIHVTIAESITAKMSREGALSSFSVKGDLQLRIADPSLTKVKLDLTANATYNAQFRTHPNVDKALFSSAKAVQLKDPSKGFPANQSVGVLRWSASTAAEAPNVLPITFTAWVNKGSDESWNIMVEYELTGDDSLRDVSVNIPYATSEPAISSFDAVYEVSGDSLEWKIGNVDESIPSGAFEFEAQAEDEGEFFPMSVRFSKTKPCVDVDVKSVTLVDMDQEMSFTRDVRSVADSYLIEIKLIHRSGQSLAVAFGTSVCIASAHSGKILYEKDYSTPSKAPICCLGWASNFTDKDATRKRMSNLEGSTVLDSLIASTDGITTPQYTPELPIELAFVDVASALPKLSTLPVIGSQGDVFSSRVSLDTLFKSLPIASADRADVLVVGRTDGTIHLSMSEDFSIGKFKLHEAELNSGNSKPFLHCSHPLSTTHALLCSRLSTNHQEIQLVPFDLRLVSIAGRQLSLLASKVTELHSLQRYLRHVQEQLSTEIRTSHDLPNRFMRNIDETLQEKSDCTWVNAAYHLAVTGHCYPEVKEWLVNELGERGHKRWDKAINLGYENVRRLTHESLLPALDRLSVLISRLRGLSRFPSSDFSLGLSTLELNNMLDSVNCLQLLAHQLLKCAVSELQQFSAFSTWLRHEIEKQSADPTSVSAQEVAEKDVSFDHSSILEYIQGAMQRTQLLAYTASEIDGGRPWDLELEGGRLFELYKNHMNSVSSGFRLRRRLPGLDDLVKRFEKQSGIFFEYISETQRRSIGVGVPISLGAGDPACADMIMVDEHSAHQCHKIIVRLPVGNVAGGSLIRAIVRVFRARFAVENGVSSTRSVSCLRIPVSASAVRDLKFIDDQFLMLAFVGPDDASTRHNAEQQLLQAAELDFSAYVSTLAHELANEQAQPHIRSAAGIALKNSFSAREYTRLRDLQLRWRDRVAIDVKTSVKDLALRTLASKDSRAGQSAAQFVASIAAIEIPRNQWPELMPALVANVGEGGDHLKQSSLVTIGYICESEDTELRDSLVQHSNAILTAVVQGARKEEPNLDVRYAAIVALSDSLEFVRTNFDNEGERNYIMQVICEATQSGESRIESGAYGCLNRIMALYYDKMKFYMEKALFGLTILGMRNQEEDVAKLAIEFWCTVCEEELAIEDDNALTQAEGGTELRPYFNFSRVAAREVVPVLLELLAQQDEDAAEEEYNISRAAYQCLQLFAQAVGNDIVQAVLGFVEQNLRHNDWHWRDAAVSAFGAIMEGPDEKMLEPLIKQALPVLIQMMGDESVQVKDSAAYTLGRICENVSDSIDPQTHLAPLVRSLFTGLSSNPKMAGSCCWALMNLADRFAGDPGANVNPLSGHFQDSITHILSVTENATGGDAQVRMAAYEVLNAFVTNAAHDSLPVIAKLSDIILQRLENTIPMQQQIVSVDDRNVLEEIQTSLSGALLAIIQRLEREIKPQADRIMHVLLQVLNSVGAKSSVPDTVFATVGALANALEEDFAKYMESFAPFLYNALGNQEEPALCAMAIGLVSDITRSLGEVSQPYCDAFMNYLLQILSGTSNGNQLRPAILQCFGDMAQAIGPHFEKYLSVVAQVLNQSSSMTLSDGAYEMFDYFVSLREGILDAWDGAILAMKQGKANSLRPHVDSIFKFLQLIAQDSNRSEALLRAAMGVIGDLAEAFPNGEYGEAFRSEWVAQLIRDVRSSQEYAPRTKDTARWAREQIKRQPTGSQVSQMS
ncbi:MAG: hypothetical protein Q9213_000840 [Squamulea squamosa]